MSLLNGRIALLCAALTLAPACTTLKDTTPQLENPIAAARTREQVALALLHTYAAVLEEATDLVARPDVPIEAKRALGAAERAATPSFDVVRIAIAAYLRARGDYEGARNGSNMERAAAALAIAGVRLEEASRQAKPPLTELQRLISTHRRT